MCTYVAVFVVFNAEGARISTINGADEIKITGSSLVEIRSLPLMSLDIGLSVYI
jgi:hypothetical protein